MRDPGSAGRAEYETPTIRSLKEEEILQEIGPAQAYTGNFPFGF